MTSRDDGNFNTSIAAIMELVNELYAVESRVVGGDSPAPAVPAALLREIQRTLALLLAPFAPYLAHELWEMLEKKPACAGSVAKVRSARLPGRTRLNSRPGQWASCAAVLSSRRMRLKMWCVLAAQADEKISAMIAGKQIVKLIIVPGKAGQHCGALNVS